jgi:hypothetical protein
MFYYMDNLYWHLTTGDGLLSNFNNSLHLQGKGIHNYPGYLFYQTLVNK